VTGHSTVGGHTLYELECTLAEAGNSPRRSSDLRAGEGQLRWQVARRLSDLRAVLHDSVRKALGSSYGTYFCGVHFAQRMRPSGTTSRLDAWCRRLAYCINNKLVPPSIAAETLRLLGAPLVDGSDDEALGTMLRAGKLAVAPEVPTLSGDLTNDAGSTCTGGGGSSTRGVEEFEEPPTSPAPAASVPEAFSPSPALAAAGSPWAASLFEASPLAAAEAAAPFAGMPYDVALDSQSEGDDEDHDPDAEVELPGLGD